MQLIIGRYLALNILFFNFLRIFFLSIFFLFFLCFFVVIALGSYQTMYLLSHTFTFQKRCAHCFLICISLFLTNWPILSNLAPLKGTTESYIFSYRFLFRFLKKTWRKMMTRLKKRNSVFWKVPLILIFALLESWMFVHLIISLYLYCVLEHVKT